MLDKNSTALVCEICGSPGSLFSALLTYPLAKYKQPYQCLCIDCLPEMIDKVTKWPYLFKTISRN